MNEESLPLLRQLPLPMTAGAAERLAFFQTGGAGSSSVRESALSQSTDLDEGGRDGGAPLSKSLPKLLSVAAARRWSLLPEATGSSSSSSGSSAYDFLVTERFSRVMVRGGGEVK